MNRIEQVFGVPRVLLPVIHPVSRVTAIESIRVARGEGTRGVFLIDQGMEECAVLNLVREVRDTFPALWIGVNLLARSPAKALKVALNTCDGQIDGIWSDDARIDERATLQPAAEEFVAARCALRWSGLYFGGVAFKYQRKIGACDLGRATELASSRMDVVCTSGPGTGLAASTEKIRTMSLHAGGTALALASGVTAENAGNYMCFAQAFLVGTGIEATLGVVDGTKIRALIRALDEAPHSRATTF